MIPARWIGKADAASTHDLGCLQLSHANIAITPGPVLAARLREDKQPPAGFGPPYSRGQLTACMPYLTRLSHAVSDLAFAARWGLYRSANGHDGWCQSRVSASFTPPGTVPSTA
jgi:hypothetical protein